MHNRLKMMLQAINMVVSEKPPVPMVLINQVSHQVEQRIDRLTEEQVSLLLTSCNAIVNGVMNTAITDDQFLEQLGQIIDAYRTH